MAAPEIDPTANVIALNEASGKRLDDLRDAQEKLASVHFKYLETSLEHLRSEVRLRAEHTKEMREAESRRLDAQRQVDVSARDAAERRQQDGIRILEGTTATLRETLRADVAVTASTIATQSAARDSRIDERLSKVELALSEGRGRSTGINFGWEKLIAVVGLLGGLLALFAYFAGR